MKKTPGDIIILHKCTKNHDYMLHCSWDMVCDQCNCYFSFWATFYHPNILENQIRTKYHYHMLYCSWDMAHDICNCYFSFVDYFCPFTLLTAQKSTFRKKKKEKNFWRYHNFTHMYHKLWSDDVRFLRYGARQTDGWTDRKSDI